MRFDFVIYFLLMIASLGLAYWSSLPKSASESTAVVDLERNQIGKITYSSDDVLVVCERRDDGRYWITHVRYKKPAEGEAAGAEKVVDKELRFLSNEVFGQHLDRFNPFEALRVIGKVEAPQAADFGLADGNAGALQVFSPDGKELLHLTVGKKSYGSSNYFVRYEKDGRVLLVDGQAIEALQKAEFRLFGRNLVDVKFEEATHAELVTPSGAKRLSQLKKDKAGRPAWSDDGADAAINPSYKSWLDRVERITLTTYADAGKTAELAAAPSFLALKLERSGKKLDELVFKKLQLDGETKYYVTSDFLGTYAEIAKARLDSVERDIPSIMSGSGGSESDGKVAEGDAPGGDALPEAPMEPDVVPEDPPPHP